MSAPRWLLAVLLLAHGLAAQAAPPAFEVEDDIQYSTAAKDPRRNSLDLLLPKDTVDPPLVMFVHGGGWLGGNKEQLRGVGAALARHGVAAAVINYRLAPFQHHPENVQDCAAAFGWLWQHAAEMHFDRDRMFAMGHSAGGHLVALMALDPQYLRAAGVPADALKGVIGLSGVYDVRPHHSVLDTVFGRDPKVRAAASPLRFARADAPPFLLFAAASDLEGLEFNSRIMCERLRMAGAESAQVTLSQQDHVSYLLRFGTALDVIGPRLWSFLATHAKAATKAAAAVAAPIAPRDLRAGNVAVRFYRGTGAARTPAVLWVGGERETPLALALARQQVAVAVAEVPIQPASVTTALQDFAGAVAWLQGHAAEFGIDPARLYVGGAQAGAVLAFAVAQEPKWLRGAGAAPDAVHGTIALSPRLDGVFPDDEALRTNLSPLALTRGDAPPLLLLYGDGDPGYSFSEVLRHRLTQSAQPHDVMQLPGTAAAMLAAACGPDDDLTAPVLAFLRR